MGVFPCLCGAAGCALCQLGPGRGVRCGVGLWCQTGMPLLYRECFLEMMIDADISDMLTPPLHQDRHLPSARQTVNTARAPAPSWRSEHCARVPFVFV